MLRDKFLEQLLRSREVDHLTDQSKVIVCLAGFQNSSTDVSGYARVSYFHLMANGVP